MPSTTLVGVITSCVIVAAVILPASAIRPHVKAAPQTSPDQRVMEQLVSTFRIARNVGGGTVPWNLDNPFNSPPVCHWAGVSCNTNMSVVSMNTRAYGLVLNGTVDLTDLPPAMASLSLSGNLFSGPLQLTALPQTLKSLDLSYNEFTGPVDLTKLPAALQSLIMTKNTLSGSVDLTKLPQSLQILYLDTNRFSGTVALSALPPVLGTVYLDNNFFTGTIDPASWPQALNTLSMANNSFYGSVDMTQLPASLGWLYLQQNRFSGAVNLSHLPSSKLQYLNIGSNQFSGSLDLTSLPASCAFFLAAENQFVGSLDLCQLPAAFYQLNVSGNRLTGTVDLSKLPSGVSTLSIRNNSLTGTLNLEQIPASLSSVTLDFSMNHFEGHVDFTKLPSSIIMLELDHNNLSGVPDLSTLPRGLQDLNLAFNPLLCGNITYPGEGTDVQVEMPNDCTFEPGGWRCPPCSSKHSSTKPSSMAIHRPQLRRRSPPRKKQVSAASSPRRAKLKLNETTILFDSTGGAGEALDFLVSNSRRTAVVTFSGRGMDTLFYVLVMNITAGQRQCQFSLPPNSTNPLPSLNEELVFIATAAGVMAFSLKNCTPVWTNADLADSDGGIGLNPALGLLHVVAHNGSALYAINSSTGAQVWHIRGIFYNNAPFATRDGGVVMISGHGMFWQSLYGFDAKKGTQLWEMPNANNLGSYMAEDAPSLVVMTTLAGNGVYGYYGISKIDAATGTLLWSGRLTGVSNGIPVLPAVAPGGYFIYNGTDSNVVMLNRSSGAPISTQPIIDLGQDTPSGLLVVDDQYVLGIQGELAAFQVFSALDGSELGAIPLSNWPDFAVASPHGAGMVVTGDPMDGYVITVISV